MAIIKPETRRLIGVIFKLAPVAINYRRDRREIRKAEGKLVHPRRYERHAVRAVRSFIELGPAFIKLGQLLSVRPDILPQPYINQFSKLQDDVPPAPFSETKEIIESEIGPIDQVFDSFDPEAVTGASLGQVYQAQYRGNQVVVKVNRPGIRERIALDTKVLRRLVPLVGRFIDPSLRFTAQSVVEQFTDTVREEMDYNQEAENLILIKKNLRHDRDVIIPNIYEEISTNKVLVLEYIPGIKILDLAALDESNVDRRKLARRVARLFFKMLLSQDIFHADPHPGNLSINASDGRIILYDFGMTGRLDEETRTKLVRFYSALADADPTRIVNIMLELGILQPFANRAVIRQGVELALADMQGKKVEESEVRALMEIANRTIYQFPFKLPKNLVLYMRMLSILEGVCLALDSKFRFIKILGRLLEDEGLVDEAFKEELNEEINKISKAIEASIEVAPMLKNFLETYPRSNRGRNDDGFVLGVLGGIGVSGLGASLYFLNSDFGKIGLVASAALLLVIFFMKR